MLSCVLFVNSCWTQHILRNMYMLVSDLVQDKGGEITFCSTTRHGSAVLVNHTLPLITTLAPHSDEQGTKCSTHPCILSSALLSILSEHLKWCRHCLPIESLIFLVRALKSRPVIPVEIF